MVENEPENVPSNNAGATASYKIHVQDNVTHGSRKQDIGDQDEVRSHCSSLADSSTQTELTCFNEGSRLETSVIIFCAIVIMAMIIKFYGLGNAPVQAVVPDECNAKTFEKKIDRIRIKSGESTIYDQAEKIAKTLDESLKKAEPILLYGETGMPLRHLFKGFAKSNVEIWVIDDIEGNLLKSLQCYMIRASDFKDVNWEKRLLIVFDNLLREEDGKVQEDIVSWMLLWEPPARNEDCGDKCWKNVIFYESTNKGAKAFSDQVDISIGLAAPRKEVSTIVNEESLPPSSPTQEQRDKIVKFICYFPPNMEDYLLNVGESQTSIAKSEDFQKASASWISSIKKNIEEVQLKMEKTEDVADEAQKKKKIETSLILYYSRQIKKLFEGKDDLVISDLQKVFESNPSESELEDLDESLYEFLSISNNACDGLPSMN